MSLINDMLRDLENREGRSSAKITDHEAQIVSEKKTSVKRLAVFGGVGVLLAGLVWGWVTFSPRLLSSDSSEPFNGSSLSASLVEAQDAGAESEKGAHETLSVETKKGIDPAVQDKVQVARERQPTLLGVDVIESAGQLQLSLVFESLPGYQLLQNDEKKAQLIVSFSQMSIGHAFEIPTFKNDLLKRVSLLPQKSELHLLVDLHDRTYVEKTQLIEGDDQRYRLVITFVATPLPDAVVLAPTEPAFNSMAKEVREVEAALVDTSPKLNKSKAVVSLEQQAYQSGLKQVKQGNFGAADESFRRALLIVPDFVSARLQLIKILQRQLKLASAEEVIKEGLAATPGNWPLRKVYARQLLQEQKKSEALTLLQGSPLPNISEDLDYYALMAALMQENSQFSEANTIYENLLQLRPQAGLWWMGKAVSLDQLGHSEESRKAYGKALLSSGLSPELRTYVNDRLQAL